jgi:hypothetical protein
MPQREQRVVAVPVLVESGVKYKLRWKWMNGEEQQHV